MRISDWSSDVCSSDLIDMTAAASATPPHGSPRLPIKLQHGSAVAPRQKHKTRLAAGAVSIQNPPRGGFWGIRDHAKARLLDLAFLVDRKSTRLNSSH